MQETLKEVLRLTKDTNILHNFEKHELDVFYQCSTLQEDVDEEMCVPRNVRVTMSYQLGSFSPITISWTKSCASGVTEMKSLVDKSGCNTYMDDRSFFFPQAGIRKPKLDLNKSGFFSRLSH